jgi:2-amino-4-hydroxy-6-hydroxymethyldihydropteridine diphosphokinase
MKKYRAFVGLGSNMGERQRYLGAATVEMNRIPGTKVVWTSSVYESDPYGTSPQPKFLNAVAELETSLPPVELLTHLKAIEKNLGRTAGERWGPREIDLDILIYEGLVVQQEDVTVPHADLEHRRFVLIPLREIAPDVVHPVSGLTVTEMAASCADGGRVLMTSYHLKL